MRKQPTLSIFWCLASKEWPNRGWSANIQRLNGYCRPARTAMDLSSLESSRHLSCHLHHPSHDHEPNRDRDGDITLRKPRGFSPQWSVGLFVLGLEPNFRFCVLQKEIVPGVPRKGANLDAAYRPVCLHLTQERS